jgi:Tripartite tricarboxylate transporter TctB family.
MSYKRATYVALSLLMVFGWVYAVSIHITTSGGARNSSIGPTYFPDLLAVLLTVLCIVSFFQTARKKGDSIVRLHYFKYVLITLSLIVAYLLAWYYIGYFYILTFVFLMSLFFIYRRNFSMKQIAKNIAIACSMLLVIYLIFEVAMSIPL